MILSDGRTNEQLLFFLGGCLVGALVGGVLPDRLEPATHPGHRAFFHSVAVAAALGWLGCKVHQQCHEESESPALGHHFLMGLTLGAILGYESHLALDAGTPSGLPLLG